jgi:TnsA endonuclease N terminal
MFKNNWNGSWVENSPKGDSHRRSREVVRPTGTIMRFKFPSRKNGKMMHCEGSLERDAIYLFETSPNVLRYGEQPPKVHYLDGNRLRRYTPDFELVLNTGEIILVEIKPHTRLEDQDVKHKLERITEHFTQLDQLFLVLTDKNISREPRLTNLKFINSELPRLWPTEAAIQNVYQQYENRFPMDFNQAKDLFAKHQLALSSLIVSGILTLDLDQAIHSETQIYSIKEHFHDSFWISKQYGF